MRHLSISKDEVLQALLDYMAKKHRITDPLLCASTISTSTDGELSFAICIADKGESEQQLEEFRKRLYPEGVSTVAPDRSIL